jgi:CRP/FNR family transcriptional regulator, dissimilatory nitrate respiration regulator
LLGCAGVDHSSRKRVPHLTAVKNQAFGLYSTALEVPIHRLSAAATMPLLAQHPEVGVLRVQLRENVALQHLTAAHWKVLEPLLEVADVPKGDTLEHQGDHSMEQYFIIEGILKRVVSNAQGKEMILRFAAETDIDTSYAAWRLKTPIPYSIRAVTRVRAVKLPMQHWVSFLDQHPEIKAEFDLEIMKLMSEVMAHTITLHLLDASGRLQRFMRKHAELVERLPKKELASYLNLSPETLSRLTRREPG